MPTATLTSKGQVTIPAVVRERLRLKTGDRIDFVFASDGEIILKPKRLKFEELRGILRSSRRKGVGVREMDRAIQESVRTRWQRATRTQRNDRD